MHKNFTSIQTFCQNCTKSFYAQPANLARGKSRCCSAKCQYAHRTRPLAERFWEKIDTSGECWIWAGSLNENGYGVIGSGGKYGANILAHRASWQIAYGPIPNGLFVCHHCDTPACVNPAHLFLGTPADNMRDATAKARTFAKTQPEKMPRGESNGISKLTAGQVLEIRSRYIPGTVGFGRLAQEYGVSKANVMSIIQRKTWRHI